MFLYVCINFAWFSKNKRRRFFLLMSLSFRSVSTKMKTKTESDMCTLEEGKL